MKLDAIIETFASQLLDPGYMAGGQIGPKLDDNVPAAIAGIEGERKKFIGHSHIS